MSGHEWEKSKENVLPLRTGRNVEALNKALQSTKEELEATRKQHMAAIAEAQNSRGQFADDPLAPHVTFVKWAIENYPTGSSVIADAIETPCRRYGKVEKYRDDNRLARLWIRYAEMRKDRLEVFEYMHKHRIGETCALVYEAWAMMLELERKHEHAEKIYRLGREKRAHPVERLAQREAEYYKRMSARRRRAEKKQQEKEISKMVEKTRAEQREASGVGRKRPQVVNVLMDSAANDQGLLSESKKSKPVRPALGSLSEREASTGHRPFVSSESVSSGKKVSKDPVSNIVPEKVSVYVDSSDSHELAPNSSLRDDEIKPIALRKAVTKEDDGLPSKWAGETLRQNKDLVKKYINPTSQPFDVYEGSDDVGAGDADAQTSVAKSQDVADAQNREIEDNKSNLASPKAASTSSATKDSYGLHTQAPPPEGPMSESACKDLVVYVDPHAERDKRAGHSMRVTEKEPSRKDLKIHVDHTDSAETRADPTPDFPKKTSNGLKVQVDHLDPSEDRKIQPTSFPEKKAQKRGLKVHVDQPENPENRATLPPVGPHLQSSRPFDHSSNVTMDRPPSPTINTKIAMRDVDDMFNTTLPMERLCKLELAKEMEVQRQEVPPAPAIQVFVDPGGEVPGEGMQPAPESNTDENRSEMEIDDGPDGDKENAFGTAPNLYGGVTNPAENPILEARVLQPIHSLEGNLNDGFSNDDDKKRDGKNKDDSGKYMDVSLTITDTSDHSKSGESPASSSAGVTDMKKLVDFFVEWTKNEETFNLLKNEDPESLNDMFDLEPETGKLVTLGPYYICPGGTSKSLVILAVELNDVYRTCLPDIGEDSDDEEHALVAVKVSDPNNIWELYIYRELEKRVGSANLKNIPRALAYFEGRGRSYLILDTVSVSTLAEANESYGEDGMPESLCMFFMVNLLKALEAVHDAGFIHNDVTMYNVLVRNDKSEIKDGARYDPSGNSGWSGHGVLLIDFNHAIDSQHWRVGGNGANALAQHAASLGDGYRHSDYRMPGANTWSYNVDCYGAAVCASKMLKVSLHGSFERFLKYDRLWKKLLTNLTSLNSLASSKETVLCMRSIRTELEDILCQEEYLSRAISQLAISLERVSSKREEERNLWK